VKRWSIQQLLGGLVLLILLSACSARTSTSSTQASGKLQVVATHSILGDLVKNVAGDAVDLHVLVGPDGDAHTYEPPPADLITLSKTDLLFENGLGFEAWLDKLYTSSGSKAERVVVTRNIEPLHFAAGDEAGELDPHVWHDVSNAISMVEIIRDALVKADPSNAETYRANAELYLGQLRDLDVWVREQVQAIPEDHRKLVTNHDTFGYFAHAYGFKVIGSAFGATTEGETSAAQIAALVQQIKDAGVPTIFAENIANTDLLNQVAQEAGVKVGPPLYTDALGQPGTDGDTYVRLIRYNVGVFAEALK